MSSKVLFLALAIYFLLPSNIQAQQDTIYVNELGVQLAKEHATYYRLISIAEEKNVEVKEYYLSNILHSIGHYTNEQCVMKNGHFIYYNIEGSKANEGHYKNGFKTGEWSYYYDEGKKVLERQLFSYPDKGYYCIQYDTYTDSKLREGKIDEFGKKNGIWKEYFYNSDSVKLISKYEVGVKQGEQIEYFRSGNIKRKEFFEGFKLVQSAQFDENGKKVKYYPAFEYPEPREPIKKYLSVRVPCFNSALRHQNIHYKFKVHKDGSLSEIEITNISDEVCKKELIQAIAKMKKWKPAKRENIPFDYTIDAVIKYYSRGE